MLTTKVIFMNKIHFNQLAFLVMFFSCCTILAQNKLEVRAQTLYYDNYQGMEITLAPKFETTISESLFGERAYAITLTSLGFVNNMFNQPTFIDYRGKRYYANHFDDALVPFFENLKVNSVNIQNSFRGTNCNDFSMNTFKPGSKASKFCKPLTYSSSFEVEITSIRVTSMSGIRELQKKIDEIEKELKKTKEKINSLEHSANLYYINGNYELAIKDLEELLTLDPENKKALRNLEDYQNKLEEQSTKNNSKTSGSSKTKNNNKNTFTNFTLANRLDNDANQLIAQGKVQEGLNKYQQAQRLNYSEARAKQIEHYSLYLGVSQLSQGVNELFDNLDASTKELDPKNMLGWQYFMIGGEKSFLEKNNNNPIPESLFFGVTTDLFIFGNLQFRTGWMQTPSTIYNLESRLLNPSWSTYNDISEKVSIYQSGYFAGISAGLNLPLNALWDDKKPYLQLSVNYGIDWMFGGNQKIIGDEFIFDTDEEFDYVTLKKTSFSLSYQFPKSKLGVSIYYNLYNIESIDLNKNLLYNGNSNTIYQNSVFRTNGRDQFNPNQIDNYNTFGLSLIKLFGTNRK